MASLTASGWSTAALSLLLLLSSQRAMAASQSQLPASYLKDISLLSPNCTGLNNPPVVPVATLADLFNMSSVRSQYNATQMVVFSLAAGVFDVSGDNLLNMNATQSNVFSLGPSMSCSYIAGSGMPSSSFSSSLTSTAATSNATTAILVNNTAAALGVAGGVQDIVIADMAIDRYAAAFNDIAADCQYAANFNTSDPKLQQAPCSTILAALNSIVSPPNAISLVDVNRVLVARVRTEGGVVVYSTKNRANQPFVNGINITIVSSVMSSQGNTIMANGIPGPVTIINNTLTAPYGSGVFLDNQYGAYMAHNDLRNLGWSCFYSRRSFNHTIELNHCRNFSSNPLAPGGSAAFYAWNGMGWNTHGHLVRKNFFHTPNQKCFYFDDEISNVNFVNNICVTGASETNGGRFNNITDNLHIWLGAPSRTGHLGDINCRATSATLPSTWPTCPNILSGLYVNNDISFLKNQVWSNILLNGTVNGAITPYSGYYTDLVPSYRYDTWCSNTAGPNNTVCTTASNTYTYNGTSYAITCAALPSENHYGFAVVYNTTKVAPASFTPGFGCHCPDNGCQPSTPQWGNVTFDSRDIVLDLNYFDLSFYNASSYYYLASLNSSDSESSAPSLFANQIRFDQYPYVDNLQPSDVAISAQSVLGMNHPNLINIPASKIGLLPANATIDTGNGSDSGSDSGGDNNKQTSAAVKSSGAGSVWGLVILTAASVGLLLHSSPL